MRKTRYTKADLIKAGLFVNLSPQVAKTVGISEYAVHSLRQKYKDDPDFPRGGLYKLCSNGRRSREEYLANGLFRDKPREVAKRMGVSIQAVRWMIQQTRKNPNGLDPELYKVRSQSKLVIVLKEEWIRMGLFEKSAAQISKETGHSPAIIAKAKERYAGDPDFPVRDFVLVRSKIIPKADLEEALRTSINWEECYKKLGTCYRTFLKSVRHHKLMELATTIKQASNNRVGRAGRPRKVKNAS